MEKEKQIVKESPIREEKKVEKKLTYEQLVDVAKQMSAQIDFLTKRNQQLEFQMKQMQLQNLYAELEFKFKALNYASFFKPSFIENIVKNIENIMTPEEEDKEEE